MAHQRAKARLQAGIASGLPNTGKPLLAVETLAVETIAYGTAGETRVNQVKK